MFEWKAVAVGHEYSTWQQNKATPISLRINNHSVIAVTVIIYLIGLLCGFTVAFNDGHKNLDFLNFCQQQQ